MSEEKPFREIGMGERKSKLEIRTMLIIAAAILLLGLLVWAVSGGREQPPGEGTFADPTRASPND